jgi:hypothetical protein
VNDSTSASNGAWMRCGFGAVALGGLVALTLCSELPAWGQQATGDPPIGASWGRPRVTWLRPGDATGLPADPAGTDELAIEPLRLALLGGHPEVSGAGAWCPGASLEANAGYGSLRSMSAFGANLLGGRSRHAPRLTLFGFSRSGCALDGAVGGGVTLAVPIRRGLSFVASAGAIYLPATVPGASSPGGGPATSGRIRADLVFPRPEGRSLSVGVDSRLRGVSFGGIF